jgi:AraC family transcriptional regulator
MAEHILLVKNMVCTRCVLAVETILNSLKISFHKVVIGEIHLTGPISAPQKTSLSLALEKIGFELIDNQHVAMVEKIKSIVLKKARNEDPSKNTKLKLSVILSDQLNHDYTYLSTLFSSIEGRTIENYFIEQRIEKAKELLVYGQSTLSQIAHELDYSSVAHLSAQFKKITGLTPSFFKEVGNTKRKALDKI